MTITVTHEDSGLVKILVSGRKLCSGRIGVLSHVKDRIKVSKRDWSETATGNDTVERNLAVVDLVGRIFVAFFASDAFPVDTADAWGGFATICVTLADLAPPNSSLHR